MFPSSGIIVFMNLMSILVVERLGGSFLITFLVTFFIHSRQQFFFSLARTEEHSLFLLDKARNTSALIGQNHRLNMELGLQILFGLHVTRSAQLRARNPATPLRIWARMRGALLVS